MVEDIVAKHNLCFKRYLSNVYSPRVLATGSSSAIDLSIYICSRMGDRVAAAVVYRTTTTTIRLPNKASNSVHVKSFMNFDIGISY